MNKDREIDLHELLYYALKKWRVIIIFSMVIALLVGIYKFTPATKSNSVLEEIEVNGESIDEIKQELKKLNEKLESQIEYNKNAFDMQIDPLNKHKASISIYIDTKSTQNYNSANSENINSSLVEAYSAYLSSSSFYSYILEHIENDLDIKKAEAYLREVLWHTVDSSACTLSISISGDTESRVKEILAAVKQALTKEYPCIQSEIGPHNYIIIMESVYTIVDYDLEKQQVSNLEKADKYRDEISEKEQSLIAYENSDNSRITSTRQILASATKTTMLTFVIAAVFAVVCYMFLGVLSRKMWNDGTWQEYKIPILGRVWPQNEKRKHSKIDCWIEKVTGCANSGETIEESSALAAANIMAALHDKQSLSASIICSADKEICAEIVDNMNKALPDIFALAGDILTEPSAVSKLSANKNVVLISKSTKTTMDEVRRIKTLLEVWGKELLGVITIR